MFMILKKMQEPFSGPLEGFLEPIFFEDISSAVPVIEAMNKSKLKFSIYNLGNLEKVESLEVQYTVNYLDNNCEDSVEEKPTEQSPEQPEASV